MKRSYLARAAIIGLLLAGSLTACSSGYTPSADQIQAKRTADLQRRANDEVGIYHPTNFTRKRLANRIGQLLDSPNLATVSYAQGMDGRLRCIGHSIGFPLPSATQTTNPQRIVHYSEMPTSSNNLTLPQPEPDGLFSPASADATWVLLVNKAGVAEPIYFEGHVATFPADVKPDATLIAQDCS